MCLLIIVTLTFVGRLKVRPTPPTDHHWTIIIDRQLHLNCRSSDRVSLMTSTEPFSARV